MGIMNLFKRKDSLEAEKRGTLNWQLFRSGLINGNTYDSVVVNEQSVMGLAAVYSSVKVISEAVGSTPRHTFSRIDGRNRDRIRGNYIDRLMVNPNPEMTGVEFWETAAAHLALRGNFYAEIVRDENGYPVILWPLRADRMRFARAKDGSLVYLYDHPNGGTYPMRSDEVFHIKGFSPDGIAGYSPLTVCRKTWEQGITVQEYGKKFYSNDARPGGVLVVPGRLDDDAFERLRDDWRALHQGEPGRIAILEEGASFNPISVAPEDAQYLETRSFNRSEIAGIFRVPPHMIADLENATFTNVEQQNLSFVTHTLVPWYSRIEAAVYKRLIMPADQGRLYIEHNPEHLLRGDLAARTESYVKMVTNGLMLPNEVRQRENNPPLPADVGDIPWIQGAMQPMDILKEGWRDDQNKLPAETRDAVPEPPKLERRNLGADRRNVQKAFRPTLADAYRRIIRWESQRIRKAAKENLGTRNTQGFLDTVEDILREREYHRNQLEPVYRSFRDAVGPLASQEIDQDFSPASHDEWLDGYIDHAITNHTAGTRAQLERVVKQNLDDPLSAVEERLDQWEDGGPSGTTRFDKTAERESVNFGQTFSKAVWVLGGITLLRWVSDGEDCPACSELDGQVTGIESSFLGEGDFVDFGEGQASQVSRDVLTPPLHSGCDCAIQPE